MQRISDYELGHTLEEVPKSLRNILAHEGKITPHYICDTEQGIYGKIAFIDHVYLYENNEWYYKISSLKVPLLLAFGIYSTCNKIDGLTIYDVLDEYIKDDTVNLSKTQWYNIEWMPKIEEACKRVGAKMIDY